MDKREALEIYLKLHNECIGHEDCFGCPFRVKYKNIKLCTLLQVDNKAIAKGAEYELKRISEAPEQKPSVPPKNVEVKTTFCAKGPISAEELEKQLKALLPQKLALEPLPKEDRAIKMPESSNPDNVNRPKHYLKGGLECIQVIKAELTPEQYKGYLYGNALKYLWRWQDKNGLEDLRKAAHYLMWLQEEVATHG